MWLFYILYILCITVCFIYLYIMVGEAVHSAGQVSWKQTSESLCLPAVYSGNEFERKLEGAAAFLT